MKPRLLLRREIVLDSLAFTNFGVPPWHILIDILWHGISFRCELVGIARWHLYLRLHGPLLL